MNALAFKQVREMSEEQAREMLEAIRWPDGAICPHCDADKPYVLKSKPESKYQRRAGLYKCSACRKQFTVTVNTVFDRSHIKLKDWIMALYLMCSSKKGMSAHQLHRTMNITYKTAWFMAHRIRLAMSQENPLAKFTGEVELDATYIGGKDRFMHKDKLNQPRGGTWGKVKVPVFALVERGGEIHARKMLTVSNYNIRDEVRRYISPSATIMTDEGRPFELLDKEYSNHEVVEHGKKEFVKGRAHTNTLEGWFSLLKRGITGTFHHVSEEHLDRYVDEFTFRYNNRDLSDAERAAKALSRIGGKRLTYKDTKI